MLASMVWPINTYVLIKKSYWTLQYNEATLQTPNKILSSQGVRSGEVSYKLSGTGQIMWPEMALRPFRHQGLTFSQVTSLLYRNPWYFRARLPSWQASDYLTVSWSFTGSPRRRPCFLRVHEGTAKLATLSRSDKLDRDWQFSIL